MPLVPELWEVLEFPIGVNRALALEEVLFLVLLFEGITASP